jgi:hypothetical protein
VRGGKRFQVELGCELGLSFLQERPPGQPQRDRRDGVSVPVHLSGQIRIVAHEVSESLLDLGHWFQLLPVWALGAATGLEERAT